MTDIAAPLVFPRHMEVMQSVPRGFEGMQPAEIAGMVLENGQQLTEDAVAWREIGASAMVLAAAHRSYLIEIPESTPVLVTRLDKEAKPVKNGPYVMLPIERCEIEIDELIVFGKSLILNGLCRATKKLDEGGRGFNIGPVQTLTFLR